MKKLFLLLLCIVSNAGAVGPEEIGRGLQVGGGLYAVEAIGRFFRDKSDINRLLAKSKSGLQKNSIAGAYDWIVGALRSAPFLWIDLIHAATTRKYYNLDASNRKKYLRGMRRLSKKQKKAFRKEISSLRKTAVVRMIGQLLMGGGTAGMGRCIDVHGGHVGYEVPAYVVSAGLVGTGYLADLIAGIILRNKYKKLVQKILKKGKKKHHPADDQIAHDQYSDDDDADEDIDNLDDLEKELALAEPEEEE